MTRHILCAVDLTHRDDARALLDEAARIAELEGAALSAVTVLPDYGMSFVGSFFKEGTLKNASAAALSALHELTDPLPDTIGKVQCIVEIGTAYEKILEAAEISNATLIIVGAHKPDLADRIIGPNAARIARNARISVLVARL